MTETNVKCIWTTIFRFIHQMCNYKLITSWFTLISNFYTFPCVWPHNKRMIQEWLKNAKSFLCHYFAWFSNIIFENQNNYKRTIKGPEINLWYLYLFIPSVSGYPPSWWEVDVCPPQRWIQNPNKYLKWSVLRSN